MKNSKLIFAIVLFTSVFSSCELLDDESDDTGKELEITNKTISGKWMVTNTSSGYESFEFTENGICIVVESTSTKSSNNENVKVGKYDFDDLGYGLVMLFEGGGTYVLDEILLTDKKASFSLTKEGVPNSRVMVETEKEEEIEDSKNTKLLARSWKVVSTTFHGPEGDIVFDDYDNYNTRLVVAFTYYGTFTTFARQKDEEKRVYGNWMWTNDDETLFKAWSNDESAGQAPILSLVELTDNSLIYRTPQATVNDDAISATVACVPEPSGFYW